MEYNNKSMNIDKPEITILSNVLSDNTIFNIPPFQRNYNWEIKNCKELFNDIINGCKKNKAHFIGIFMYYNEGPSDGNRRSNVLVDGQQRLTTLMLLLCAIRDVTLDNNLKNDINTFIRNSNKNLNKFKLKQNNNDDNLFNNVLDGVIDDKPSDSNVKKNYFWFVKKLKEIASDIDFNILFDYVKKLESIEIVLNNDNINNVQEIFEKINSTGVRLCDADLVRNFVLFTPNVRTQNELYKMWCCMEKIVGLNKMEKFIRAYTIRHTYNMINKNDVYDAFKEKFHNKEKKVILDDMLKYSIYYSIIENHTYCSYDKNYSFEKENNKKQNAYIDNTLRLLNSLGTDDVVPLMMQLYSKLYEKKSNRKILSNLLELLLEFMIRYRIVKPSSGGGSLDNKLCEIMRDIETKKCELTFNALYKKLSSGGETTVFPNNSKFIERMKTDIDPKNGRVLLFQFARRKKREISTYYLFNNITLEHFMPQTIKKGTENGDWWIKNLGPKYEKIRDDYTDCIGNYGLLSGEINPSISNKPWPEKRKIISEKVFDDTTREVAESEVWKKANIAERNNKLAKEIAEYITGPKRDYKTNYKWLSNE